MTLAPLKSLRKVCYAILFMHCKYFVLLPQNSYSVGHKERNLYNALGAQYYHNRLERCNFDSKHVES